MHARRSREARLSPLIDPSVDREAHSTWFANCLALVTSLTSWLAGLLVACFEIVTADDLIKRPIKRDQLGDDWQVDEFSADCTVGNDQAADADRQFESS
jgi:hypothetical protein